MQVTQAQQAERFPLPVVYGPMASLIRNHQITEDLPATVSLVLPHRQIFVHQALAAVECRLRPAPLVDKVTLLTRSPRLYLSRARPSKTRKLSSHVSLDLKPSPETLSCWTAVNSILPIRRGNHCDVPGFHSIDRRLISSIDPGPRQGSHRAALRDHRHRKQYTHGYQEYEFFHSFDSPLQDYPIDTFQARNVSGRLSTTEKHRSTMG